jgi:DNA-binding CsgD family transcriptional regulator
MTLELHGRTDAEKDESISGVLKSLGAFRRGTGVRSPRSMEEAERKTISLSPWMEDELQSMGRADTWCELDALAETVRLTPLEKAVLGMEVIGEYSYRQMAEELGITIYRVREARVSARKKCRWRLPFRELPASPRMLFWEEVRQKKASIYRAPLKSRLAQRKGGFRRG